MNLQQKDKYNTSVFINCPFDKEYKPLFDAMVFTIAACGFTPRAALEEDDSNDIRIKKIIKIIKECKYGIHDLSRIETSEGFPRFNMPLELGIFIGALEFGTKNDNNKKYLVLDKNEFHYKRFISDLGGQDIKSHKNEISEIMKCVRDWLKSKTSRNIPHGSKLGVKYQRFQEDLPELCKDENWTVEELSFTEYSALANSWLQIEDRLL